MKNEHFEVTFHKESGAIKSIVFATDETNMNWCGENCEWGLIRSVNKHDIWGNTKYTEDKMTLKSFHEGEASAVSVYTNGMIEVTVTRFFSEKGRLTERFSIKNIRDTDIYIGQDNFGITVPLCDIYTNAEECMKHRCNAHIWCGKSTSYINALRMGVSTSNLGLVLTKGCLESYSIEGCVNNVRGTVILNSSFFHLTSGEETVIEWELFCHSGNAEFETMLKEYENTVSITAPHFTVFENEEITFTAEGALLSEQTKVLCNGKELAYDYDAHKIFVTYPPDSFGAHRFEIVTENATTYAEFNVVSKLETLVEKRIHYIIDHQQCKDEKSPLYGAFLIYDTKEKHQVYDGVLLDHNACRERLGMALLLIKYLQTHQNEKFSNALHLYLDFVERALYDEETGVVYGKEGAKNGKIRLYDAPWMIRLFAEMYTLTKDTRYTDRIAKTVMWYYKNGGSKFYPNGISFAKIDAALQKSQNPNADNVFSAMKTHAETILANGVFYPKHEVNYEQTIVTPAVTLLSEMGFLTGDDHYTKEAALHVKNLERFSGHQPSFHLNEIPIRYWDDFWFGKSFLMGDTFPHYWSCLTAWAYFKYYRISKDTNYLTAGKECLRNCLCLFNETGAASCAYVYPYTVDGKPGQFYDEWANDQDFALYFLLDSFDDIKTL